MKASKNNIVEVNLSMSESEAILLKDIIGCLSPDDAMKLLKRYKCLDNRSMDDISNFLSSAYESLTSGVV